MSEELVITGLSIGSDDEGHVVFRVLIKSNVRGIDNVTYGVPIDQIPDVVKQITLSALTAKDRLVKKRAFEERHGG